MTKAGGERGPRSRGWVGLGVRTLVSLGVLVAVVQFMDGAALVDAVLAIHPGWVGVALAATLGQVALLGWRWRITARAQGLELARGAAVAEYYRSLFLNQVLPGGVLGDVSRAWRHARVTPDEQGPAVKGVILERISGQVVMTGWAALAFGLLMLGRGARIGVGIGVGIVAGILLAVGVVSLRMARRPRGAGGGGWAFHLGTGLLLVASYVGVFVVAGLAVGAEAPIPTTALLAAPVLMAMLIPVSWAGWGVREAAAAGLWALAGLPPADGVLVSVGYGTLVFLGSLPGGLLLLATRPGARREELAS